MKQTDTANSTLLAETGHCVACGLCLPYCPTYHKTQSEADSPRGRILLTQAVLQGILPINERYMAHMDLCLTCRACERACPNHVPYGAIADHARVMIHKQRKPTLLQRLAAKVLGSPLLLRLGGYTLRFAQVLKLNQLIKALPTASRQYHWKAAYPVQSARGDVALFLGCVSNVLDGEALAAAIFVLNRLGYTVHVPAKQTCCGGLHRQSGDCNGADALDARNHAAFAAVGDMPLLVLASGCGARLLETMPEQVQDINAFLLGSAGWENVALQPLHKKVAVHEPCTLRNVLKAGGVQQALLQRIPGIKLVTLPGNAQCCGGAGSYMLTQPEMANNLRDDKTAELQACAPDIMVTANIGCALHIARGLKEAEVDINVMHPVALLAQQMGFTGEPSC